MNRRAAVRAAAVACALLVTWACATVASAAPRYEVQVWPQGDTTRPDTILLIASIDLGPSVALPATVRIPVPRGAEVSWAGEITGGAAEDDIQRAFEITSTVGGDVLVMTLETTGNAQYDAWWGTVGRDGDAVTGKAEWLQTEPADGVAFTVRMPPGAGDVTITPAPVRPPDRNAIGETLYTLPKLNMEPGDKASVAFAFVPGGASEAPAAAGANTTIQYVLGILAVLLIALVAVVVVERRKRREAETLDV